MSFPFFAYPHTDLNQPNLDWIIQQLKNHTNPVVRVVDAYADMTDHQIIYVYVGHETGYEYGHWYYWDSGWVDGGAFGAGDTDDLTTEAKDVVGAINEINSKLDTGEMHTDYVSIISDDIRHFDSLTYNSNLSALVAKFPDKLSMHRIGTSYLGTPWYMLRFGKLSGATYKTFIIGQQHANELHTAWIILKSVEYYCQNWDTMFYDEKVSQIMTDAVFHLIPMCNPDGADLVIHGLNAIPVNFADRETLINNIEAALETKIRTNLSPTDYPADWDLASQVVQLPSGKYGVPGYTFREQDLVMWKANLEGIDLHYNCWTDDVNRDAYNNPDGSLNSAYTQGVFASQNDIGTVGFGAKENQLLKTVIDTYHDTQYTASFHGRTPMIQWNYGAYGVTKRRTLGAVQCIAKETHTRYQPNASSSVGLAGWMQQYANKIASASVRQESISMIWEVGWLRMPVNENNGMYWTTGTLDTNPLENAQAEPLFRYWKNACLRYMQMYARERDLYLKYETPMITAPVTATGILRQYISGSGTYANAAAGYTINDLYIQKIQGRAFVKGNITISGKGTITGTDRIALYSAQLPPAANIGNTNRAVGIGTLYAISNFTNPYNAINSLSVVPVIFHDQQNIQFAIGDLNPGAGVSGQKGYIRGNDIGDAFSISFAIDYPIDDLS